MSEGQQSHTFSFPGQASERGLPTSLARMRADLAAAVSLTSDEARLDERLVAVERQKEESQRLYQRQEEELKRQEEELKRQEEELKRQEEERKKALDRLETDKAMSASVRTSLDQVKQNPAYKTEVKKIYIPLVKK